MSSKMKNSLLALAAAATLAALPVAQAADLKVGFVNYQKLLEESPQAKAASASLEGEFAQRQRELVTQQKALKDKEDKLQREAAVMSEADRGKAERELRDGQRDLSRKANELQEDFNLRRNEELGKINRALLGEVQNYARSNGFNIVFSDGVVYASEGIDITPQLIAMLKAKSPAAPAAAPAAQPKK